MPNLRHALRTWIQTPLLTFVSVLSLALGIGANTATFSMFDQILLRPLPAFEPEELVNLSAPGPKPGTQSCNGGGVCDDLFSYPMFRDLEREQNVFTGLAAHHSFRANLTYQRQASSGQGMLVSGNYFPVLGLKPALGRLLGPEDDRIVGGDSVVVLSHRYWQSRFAESPQILGESLIVNGQPMTIVGVAPQDFTGTTLGLEAQVFVPLTMYAVVTPGFSGFEDRRMYSVYVFARLAPGISIDEARSAINVPYRAIISDVEAPLQKGMSDETMARFRSKEISLMPGARGQSTLHRDAQAPLSVLLWVSALVLVIACANIANLLLARGAGRDTEMAVRLSVGANRAQVVGQLLTESVILGLFGGVAALLVAGWTMKLIVRSLPPEATHLLRADLDLRLLLVTFSLALVTGALFGLFPALHGTRSNLVSSLRTQSARGSSTPAAKRFRSSLATAQIALSMALLIAAGLFTKSLYHVSQVDLGYPVDHLVTFGISPGLNGYRPQQSRDLFQRLEAELDALPAVTAATGSMVPLLTGNSWRNNVDVEGFDAGPDADRNSRYNEVSPGFFRAVGIPLLSGREFTEADGSGSPKVAIVNETFARKFGLGRDAVGKRMAIYGDDSLDIEIVGLVRDAKYSLVKQEIPPQYFLPYRQDDGLGALNFYVRTAAAPGSVMAAIRGVVDRLDPNLPIETFKTMDEQFRENVYVDRLTGTLSVVFAALATLLAAVGLYGVLAYTIAQRTREFGLRMALGADRATVQRSVFAQVGKMTLVGAILGVGAALALGRLARSILFEIEGHDPAVLAAAALILAVVAFVAGFVPARRASRIDPMRALRYE